MSEKNLSLDNEQKEYPIGKKIQIIHGENAGKSGIVVNKRYYKNEDGQESYLMTIQVDNASSSNLEEFQTDILNIV